MKSKPKKAPPILIKLDAHVGPVLKFTFVNFRIRELNSFRVIAY